MELLINKLTDDDAPDIYDALTFYAMQCRKNAEDAPPNAVSYLLALEAKMLSIRDRLKVED